MNYKAVDHVENYNFGVSHVNARGRLKIPNFESQNLGTENEYLELYICSERGQREKDGVVKLTSQNHILTQVLNIWILYG